MKSLSIFLLMIALAAPLFADDEQLVQRLSANGSRNMRPFTVEDRWEVRWENKGSMLNVTIYTADGKPFASGGMATAPGSGQSFQPKGGSYYFSVSGSGEWMITVVQLP